ncbi:hypothetical protein CRUP_027081, partial [Coryphaenoides rupestris]
MMCLPHRSPGGVCAAALTLMSLGLLSVHVSIPKQVVVLDKMTGNMANNGGVKSMATLEEEEEEEEEEEDDEGNEGKKKMEPKILGESHTNYLMKAYCYPGIVQLRNLSSCDNIVVESCTLRFKLRDTPAHHIFSAP